jgi:hypothetical protein
MAETHFEIYYSGAAVDKGRMAVRDLVPSLLPGRPLLRGCVDPLSGERPVSLEVEAHTEGSFGVELVVFKELVIGSSVDFSLVGSIKWLNGRRVSEESPGLVVDTTKLLFGAEEAEVPSEVAVLIVTEQKRQ